MSKQKYSIIDNDGNPMGFVIVDVPTFQHTTPTTPIALDGPIADVILLAGCLAGFTAIPYLFGADWLSAVIGVSITASLAAIKARYGAVLPVTDQEHPTGVHITGEFVNDSTMHLDEIRRPDLRMQSLISMCRAMAENGYQWVGRPTAKKYKVTRGQHDIIRVEFERLSYLSDGDTGKEPLNGRGRLFVRKVVELSEK